VTAPFDQQVTFLYTADLAATADFYEKTLGLPLALDQGGCRIYGVAQNAFLGFCSHSSAGRRDDTSGVVLTLVTDEVDAWYERLRARGVPFERAPAHNETYNIYHCFFRDPNGYLIEIQRFLDPAWPRPATHHAPTRATQYSQRNSG
jgi:catechol 2,3-dioxygenase-like lactoylglutathione lyase family enzyme